MSCKNKNYTFAIMSELRKILYPFALVYGSIIRLRNFLYDTGIFKAHHFKTPSICVGNLNVGGSGKTPFLSFLIDHYQHDKKIAVLSRGYKRKTTGFKKVEIDDSATAVGDEPLQFKLQFPDINVAVDEKRANGMRLLENELAPDLILLDDAFQHRAVKADINILLTLYNKPFPDDLLLPAGDLREPASGAQRADVIVVTKSPPDLSLKEHHRLKKKLQAFDEQPIFFSHIDYADQVIGREKKVALTELDDFTLVTGIAQAGPLLEHLKSMNKEFRHLRFADHHVFTRKELENIKAAQPILTTQKDFMRLKEQIDITDIYYLPIRFSILDGEERFFELLNDRLEKKARTSFSSDR